MLRPDHGPLWPPTDDTVENSLRRAYLRAAQPAPGSDPFPDLLRHLAEVLAAAEPRRSRRQSA